MMVREPEPPADCQDCLWALDKCAEYKALNHEDYPYNRRGCRMYKPGRKGYETPFQCEVCGVVYPSRWHVHTQADNSEKGWRYICCRCLSHEPLSCLNRGCE